MALFNTQQNTEANETETDSDLTLETRTLLDEEFWNEATPQKVQELISRGADLNAKNKNGFTAAHFAAIHGDVSILKILAENGADLNIGDNIAETPAHKVAKSGQSADVLKTLAQYGADMNQTNIYGESPENYIEQNYQQPDEILNEIDSIQQRPSTHSDDYIKTDGRFTSGKKGNISWFSNTGNPNTPKKTLNNSVENTSDEIQKTEETPSVSDENNENIFQNEENNLGENQSEESYHTDESIQDNQPQIISDDDIAIALSPERDTISMDENGNFVDKSNGTIYTRDPENPNVLHSYDPNNEGQEQTINLGITSEGGISITSSYDASPDLQSTRVLHSDGSYQETSPLGMGESETKKTVDADGNSITEYSTKDALGTMRTERSIEKKADGTERTNTYDGEGNISKSEFKYPDGSKAEVDANSYVHTRPDGSIISASITNNDGTSIDLEQDGKGGTKQTYFDKDHNPVLIEQKDKNGSQYLKQGTDGQWHVMPDNGDDFESASNFEKIKNMTPEEVDKIIKAQQSKEHSSLASETPSKSELSKETSTEKMEIPPHLFEKPIVPSISYTAGDSHSITNNVEVVRTVNIRLTEGVKAGKDDSRNEMREIQENKTVNPTMLSVQVER